MALIAQYKGTCADCGGAIEPGQWIVRRDDAYAHLECPEVVGLRKGETVCVKCFMVKAADGSCECGVG